MKKRFKHFLIALGILFVSSTVSAGWFGEDSILLGKILSVATMQNITMGKSLAVARDHLVTIKGLLNTVQNVFSGTQLPHDFIPWDEGVLNEISFPRDSRLEQIVEDIKSVRDIAGRFRMDDLLHGEDLQQLVGVVQDAWDLQLNIPHDSRNRQDAISTLVALQSLDAGRRALPLLPDMNDSLERLIPEVNRASPGRSLQLNTHLNFLQAVGLQHLVETQAATAQVSAVRLLNEQEKEKESVKGTVDVYDALATVVSEKMK